MASVTKRIGLPATRAVQIIFTGAVYNRSFPTLDSRVARTLPNLDTYTIYFWDISSVRSTIFPSERLARVQNVDLFFWHYDADGANPIGSVDLVGVDVHPVNGAAANVYNAVQNSNYEFKTQRLNGNIRESIEVRLGTGESSQASGYLSGILLGDDPYYPGQRDWFAVGIRQTIGLGHGGSLRLGSISLAGGQGDSWTEASEDPYISDILSPPILYLTYELDEEHHIRLAMRYTTASPGTAQSTPQNSLGGYLSTNNIYDTFRMGWPIGKDDAVIPTDDLESPSLTSGLAQVGPEILKYTGTSTIGYAEHLQHRLTGVTRGISPGESFPAMIARSACYGHYLDVDELFNTAPSSTSQYRCVAVLNTTNTGTHLTDNSPSQVRVRVVQDSSSDVSVDVGIEIPKFDTHVGVIAVTSSSTSLIDESNFTSYAAGFFNNAFITTGSSYAIVSTFSFNDDGYAVFALDRSISITAGSTFRIYPAPSQTIDNEATGPGEANGRFLGFIGSGGEDLVDASTGREHGDLLHLYDLFYVWIKRSITRNLESSDDTGAVIVLEFIDPSIE